MGTLEIEINILEMYTKISIAYKKTWNQNHAFVPCMIFIMKLQKNMTNFHFRKSVTQISPRDRVRYRVWLAGEVLTFDSHAAYIIMKMKTARPILKLEAGKM